MSFLLNPYAYGGVLPVTDVFSRYTADSFASTTWSDVSGNNRHATVSRGSVSLTSSSGNGSTKTFGTLQGGTGDGILFPTDVLPSTYTVFHLSRYTGSSNFRIVTGTGNNWLSGHWSGNTGVAFHEGWITNQVNRFGNNWVLSTDQNSLYRGNRTTYGTSGGSASTRLTVNAGQYTEYSAWQVAEIIVYNRTLSLEEYTSVENFLVDNYGLS